MENIRAFYYDFRNKLIQIKIDSDISPLKDYQTKSYDMIFIQAALLIMI